jgi:hypothetical protein
MVLGSTQPLTEMSTRNLPGSKIRSVSKADNLTTICEPTVWNVWEPRRLVTGIALLFLFLRLLGIYYEYEHKIITAETILYSVLRTDNLSRKIAIDSKYLVVHTYFYVCHLTTLAITRLHSLGDTKSNDCFVILQISVSQCKCVFSSRPIHVFMWMLFLNRFQFALRRSQRAAFLNQTT